VSGPSLAAARVGDRISHAAQVIVTDSEALLGVALGALATVAHTAGALAAAIGAGATTASGHVKIATSAVLPITVSGAVVLGSPNTFVGKPSLPAALAVLHLAACGLHAANPIRMGSATVFANGLRLSRQTDLTTCGAIIVDGAPTVLVGGATVDAAPPDPLAAVAQVTKSAAVAAAAVGAALRAGAGAAEAAVRWGEGLATAALSEAGAVVTQVEESVIVVEGEIAAKASALVGAVGDAANGALGALFGALLGDRSKP
jgi:uncharacterized Zn-binding protein involved in type VI secretion